MASRNEQVYQMAQEWLIWLNSRKFLGQPPQKNILVALAEKNMSKGMPPDAIMSAELAAFNIAVNTLDNGSLIPFITVYCDFKTKPVKTLAIDLGIGRDQFYERAHKAALNVIKTSRYLVILHGQMKREVESIID